MILLLGFSVAAVLKIAQGSSTVAMITGSAMLAGVAGVGYARLSPGLSGHGDRVRIAGRILDERQRFLDLCQDERIDGSRGPEVVDDHAIGSGVCQSSGHRAAGHPATRSAGLYHSRRSAPQ